MRAPEDAVIASVQIAGLDDATAATLRSALRTRPGMRFGDAPIKDDLQRLWGLGVVSDAHVEATGGDVVFVLAPQPRIHDVVLHGESDMMRRFALLHGAPFEPHRLWRMASALEQDYVRDGHVDARVAVAQSWSGPDVDVCVVADPGPRVTVASIAFPGRRAVPEADLRAVMHTKTFNHPGALYDEESLGVDQLYISTLYWDRGYANVKVGSPRMHREGARLAIEVPIVEGDRFTMSSVTIAGGFHVPLPIHAGDMFSRSKIAAARDALVTVFGDHVEVVTHVDADRRQIALSFEPQWRWPWDAVMHSSSR